MSAEPIRLPVLDPSDVHARLAKAEAAIAVYDRLGVELVAQLKALKMRVDALEAKLFDREEPT